MGQTAAELQREVAEQRQRIETKLDSLRQRLRTDATDAREAVAEDTSQATTEAKTKSATAAISPGPKRVSVGWWRGSSYSAGFDGFAPPEIVGIPGISAVIHNLGNLTLPPRRTTVLA